MRLSLLNDGGSRWLDDCDLSRTVFQPGIRLPLLLLKPGREHGNLLEAIRILGLEQTTRFYQASTSELYGLVVFFRLWR